MVLEHSFFFTLKEGKFGFNASGGLNFLLTPETTSGLYRQSIGPVPTELIQSGGNRRNGIINYQSAEVSYEIDSLNLITGSIGYNKNALNIENNLISTLYNQDKILNKSYNLNNTGNDDRMGYDLGLDYQLGFKRNKEQLLTASYKTTNSKNDRDNLLLSTERINYSETTFPDLEQINASGAEEHTVQLDYTQPFKWINIEGGIKGIFRNNFSDYEQLKKNASSGVFETDNSQTNQFDYQQNVFGMYNSYQVKLKNWGIKAGMRLERTVVNADFISTSTQVKQEYNNFIPSVSLQRKFKNFSSLNIGYTQRIERPGIQQLNPFINQSNRQSVSYGNPNLRAVLNHSFELTYSSFKKTTVNMSVNYSFANHTIENVVTLGNDNISRQTWANLGQDKKLGLNMSLNIPVTDKLTIRANGRISHVWIEGAYNGRLYKNDGVQGNISSTAIYRFNQGFRATINGGYHGPVVLLQGASNGAYYSIMAINKEFLNKKATFSLAVNNPFTRFRKFENELNTATFIQTSYSSSFFRSLNMNFNYRFGKLKEAIKKNKRSINNDDVKN